MNDRLRRDDLLFAFGLFAVAFAARLIAARLLAGEAVWDGHYYDFGAKRIAEGHGYSDDRVTNGIVEWHPWCHYPVGYSGYLAAFYRVFGSSTLVAAVANALVGGAVSVVVFSLGQRALSPRRARVAGVLTALHPGLVLYSALVMSEVLAALTVLGAFLLATFAGDARRGRQAWVAACLVLGVGALVRPQALLCAPFLALALPRRRLLGAALACALALVPVLPWTARNCRVMDGCALVSTNGGWNLAIGSFPRATGRFETLRSSDGCREVTGQVQQDRCWFAYGLEHIGKTPGRWLGLVPAKLSNTFDHESFAVEYLREARPHDWPEARRVAWRTLLTAVHRVSMVVAPLAFVALFTRRRGRDARVQAALLGASALVTFGLVAGDTPIFWPFALVTCALACLPLPGRPAPSAALLLPVVLLASTAFTHAVFFGDDRYHIVVTPALCLLAAAALRSSDAQNTRGADTGGVRAAGTSPS